MRTTNNTLKTALFTLALTSASFIALTGNVQADSGSQTTTEATADPARSTGERTVSGSVLPLPMPPISDDPFERADINRDGVHNIDDMVVLLMAWGVCPAQTDSPCYADINLDANIDQADLVFLLRLINLGANEVS